MGLVDIALCRVLSDAGLRRSEAAALTWDDVARWDDGSGRLTVGRSKTDAEARTVYLTPASMEALRAMRPAGAHGAAALFGLSAPSISRRIRAAAAVAGLGLGFSGHSGRVGMARRMAAARRADAMRSWRRDAGRRRGWWRSIRGRKRRGGPRSGWRKRRYHDSTLTSLRTAPAASNFPESAQNTCFLLSSHSRGGLL